LISQINSIISISKWLIPHRPINQLEEAEDLEEDLVVEDEVDVEVVVAEVDEVVNVEELMEDEVVQDVEEETRMMVESGSQLPNLDDSSKIDSSRSWKRFSCSLYQSRSIKSSIGS